MEILMTQSNVPLSTADWTIMKVIQWAEPYLAKYSIEFPRLNIEYFLAKLLNYRRIDLYVNYDQPLTSKELAAVKSMVRQRVQGKPLQYIVGEIDFYNISLTVNQDVLIPRPETELLVDAVLNYLHSSYNGACMRILELGTGSGNIAVALAKNFPDCIVYACDVSADALAVAKENAVRNEVTDRIIFFQADMRNEWNRTSDMLFDCIVSNPPYIPESDKDELPRDVVEFEPHVSLFASGDGTEFHKRIIDYFGQWLKEGGKIYMEIGIRQAQKVRYFFEQAGYADIVIDLDHQEIQRMVHAMKRKVTHG